MTITKIKIEIKIFYLKLKQFFHIQQFYIYLLTDFFFQFLFIEFAIVTLECNKNNSQSS